MTLALTLAAVLFVAPLLFLLIPISLLEFSGRLQVLGLRRRDDGRRWRLALYGGYVVGALGAGSILLCGLVLFCASGERLW